MKLERKINGFTLIELLVVIAIIAILAAILFPVFAAAREKARQSSCSSNMKQLGLAFIQYCQDYDETVPGIWDNSSGSDATPVPAQSVYPHSTYAMPEGQIYIDGMGWAGQLYPYVKSTGIYTCPDDPTQAQIVAFGTGTITKTPISYAYNNNLPNAYQEQFDGYGTGAQSKVGTLSGLTGPSNTVLFSEIQGDVADPAIPGESDSFASCGVYGFPEPASNPTQIKMATGYQGGRGNNMFTWFGQSATGEYTGPTGIHTGGSNFTMADGHVKWLHPNTVSTGYYNSGNANTPQNTYQAAGTQVSTWVATYSGV